LALTCGKVTSDDDRRYIGAARFWPNWADFEPAKKSLTHTSRCRNGHSFDQMFEYIMS